MYAIEILLIAVALSMDTFCSSLSLGFLGINKTKGYILSIIVGIMHFIMPLLGNTIGNIVLIYLPFNHDTFLGLIFLTLAFKTIYDVYFSEEKEIKINIIGIITFAISVSFDAFTTGIGLTLNKESIIIASTIFMIVSFLFTITGITIGKYVNEKFGKVSASLGIILLFTMAMYLII